jgi:hypothetical protein
MLTFVLFRYPKLQVFVALELTFHLLLKPLLIALRSSQGGKKSALASRLSATKGARADLFLARVQSCPIAYAFAYDEAR